MSGHYNSYWEHLLNKAADRANKKYYRYILSVINGGYYVARYEYHVFLVYRRASIPVAVASYKPP